MHRTSRNHAVSARPARQGRTQTKDDAFIPSSDSKPSIGWLGSRSLPWVICLALAVATLGLYLRTSTYEFVGMDDDQYVYDNPMVQSGLSTSGIVWAFTTFFFANWHPLTWLSLMLDSTVFGPGAGARHVMNVAFHTANTILLFIFLMRLTR